jgi:hypothetical protein
MPGDIGVASEVGDEPDDEQDDGDGVDPQSVDDPEVIADVQEQLNDLNESVVETHQMLIRREENIKDLYRALSSLASKCGYRYTPDSAVVEEDGSGEFVVRDMDAGDDEIELETYDGENSEGA